MCKYHLRAEMKRPLLNKDLQSQAEFIVENKVKRTLLCTSFTIDFGFVFAA